MTDRITSLKTALLAYVVSFGVPAGQQRQIAAQLGRIMPHGHSAAQSLNWLDQQVENWAFALLGRHLSAHQVRHAFWQGQLDPTLLLRIPDGSEAFAALAHQLAQHSRPAMPARRVTIMPVQSLARRPALAQTAPVLVVAAQRA